jgi:hypothetical protein
MQSAADSLHECYCTSNPRTPKIPRLALVMVLLEENVLMGFKVCVSLDEPVITGAHGRDTTK